MLDDNHLDSATECRFKSSGSCAVSMDKLSQTSWRIMVSFYVRDLLGLLGTKDKDNKILQNGRDY
jgi:hypothetical protein